MGISYAVTGLRSLGSEFEKMMRVKKFCDTEEVELPDTVARFFDGHHGSDEAEIRDSYGSVDITSAVQEGRTDDSEYYVVDLKKLPEGVDRVLRSKPKLSKFKCVRCGKTFKAKSGPTVTCGCGSIYAVWLDYKPK